MITGIDIVYQTKLSSYLFFYNFENHLKAIWKDFYKVNDLEDGTLGVFYSKTKEMFDSMDDKGYHLDSNDEGVFLIMFNENKAEGNNSITVVLPENPRDSSFCEKINSFVETSLV